MGAVSNTTQLASTVTVSRTLSDVMSPEFKRKNIGMALMHIEDLPIGQATNVKGFRRRGAITTTAIIAEATAQGLQANFRQDTAVNATAAKVVRVDGISIENQTFGQVDLNSYAESQAFAISRAVDSTKFGLYSSITNQVNANGVLTLDHLDEAQLNIFQSEVPMSDMPLAVVLGGRGYRDIKKDLRDSGGAAYSNERFLSIFNGPPQVNGYVGSLPGFELFAVPEGLSEASGQNIQAVFHPRWAFAGMFDSSVNVWMIQKGSEGLYTELLSYYFYAIVLWNDGAACELLSEK
jgi:hypothetical protein